MARFDRCYVCDYSETEGSVYSNLVSGQNGKVVYDGDRPICEVCADEIFRATVELNPEPKDDWGNEDD